MSFANGHARRNGRVRRHQLRPAVTELLEPRRLLSSYVASTVYSFNGSAGAEEPYNALTQVNGLIYGETSSVLYSLNPSTDKVTSLANIGSSFSAPAYLNGNLYLSSYYNIQEYNISTKQLTTINSTLSASGTNLIDVGGNFYGESYGHAGAAPFLYEINTTTNKATTLYTLTQGSMDYNVRNMADIGGNLYGAYEHTLFEYNLTTNEYSTVYTFNNGAGSLGLVEIGGICYGTAEASATTAASLFQFNPTSHTITTLATFSTATGYPLNVSLINGNLYGTTSGAEYGGGTVYEYNLSSKTVSTIASFNSTNGSIPQCVVYADGHFYGTTAEGGAYGYDNFGYGNGNIFELLPGDDILMSPQLDNVTLRVDPSSKSDIEVLNGNTKYEDLPESGLAQIDVLGESYLFGGQSSVTINYSGGFFDVPVTFIGGIGLPQMNVANTLSIVDSATSGNRQWNVASDSMTVLDTGLSANPTILYNAVQNVSLTGRSIGDETMTVQNTSTSGITLPTMTTLNLTSNDQVNVTGTATPLTIVGTGSSASNLDGVDIGSLAPNLGGTLTGILAPITVNNVSELAADDSGDKTSSQSTLSTTAITGFGLPASAPISYKSVNTLKVHGGTANNSDIVNSNSAITTLYPGGGTSQVIVAGNAGPLTINGGSHTDNINIGAGTLSLVTAPITITSTASASTLEIDAVSNTSAHSGTISSTSITGFSMGSAAAVNYTGSQLTSLSVFGGSGANTDLITGTSTYTILYPGTSSASTVNVKANSSPLLINGSTKVDYITIGSLAPSLGGTLAAITAPITVANTSASSTITLDDSGDTASRSGTITPTAVTGFGMGSSGALIYKGTQLAALTVHGGKGSSNTETITGTSTPTTLYPGTDNTGESVVYIRATTAALTINGDGNIDLITIGSVAPSLGGTLTGITAPITVTNTSNESTLTLDDSGDTVVRTGTLTPTTITGLGMASSAKVTYTGSDLHLLTIRGNKGGAKLTETGTSCPVTLINA